MNKTREERDQWFRDLQARQEERAPWLGHEGFLKAREELTGRRYGRSQDTRMGRCLACVTVWVWATRPDRTLATVTCPNDDGVGPHWLRRTRSHMKAYAYRPLTTFEGGQA